jgi:acyl carrier protein
MNMKREKISNDIKNILIQILNLEIEPEDIDNDTLLLDGEIYIDSLAIIQIINMIEETFDIVCNEEEINSELLSSVTTLTDFVCQKIPE